MGSTFRSSARRPQSIGGNGIDLTPFGTKSSRFQELGDLLLFGQRSVLREDDVPVIGILEIRQHNRRGIDVLGGACEGTVSGFPTSAVIRSSERDDITGLGSLAEEYTAEGVGGSGSDLLHSGGDDDHGCTRERTGKHWIVVRQNRRVRRFSRGRTSWSERSRRSSGG